MRRHAVLFLLIAGCAGKPTKPEIVDPMEPPVTRHTQSGEDRDPEVTANGDLFFVTKAFSSHYDLYMKKIGGTTMTRIAAHEEADERFPAVNPDPRYPNRVAFASNVNGEWDIWLIMDFEKDPGKWVRVSEEGMQSIRPSWSPDGTKLVWCSTDESGSGEWVLKVRDMIAGKTVVLEGVDGFLPRWNPKDNRIVLQRMSHRDRRFGSVWTLELQERWVEVNGLAHAELGVTNLRVVISGDDEWAAINPCWTADGTRIVFATVAKSRARAGILDEGDDLWMVDADGGRPTRLTTNPAPDWMPCCAPSGEIFFVSKRDGRNHIWSLTPKSLP